MSCLAAVPCWQPQSPQSAQSWAGIRAAGAQASLGLHHSLQRPHVPRSRDSASVLTASESLLSRWYSTCKMHMFIAHQFLASWRSMQREANTSPHQGHAQSGCNGIICTVIHYHLHAGERLQCTGLVERSSPQPAGASCAAAPRAWAACAASQLHLQWRPRQKREATCCRCLPAKQPACGCQACARTKVTSVCSMSIVVVQSALQPVPDKERYDWGLTNGVPGRG